MNTLLWIIAGVLAVVFAAAGLMKITQPKEKLAAFGLAWTQDFTAGQITSIGLVELLGAIGLVLPGALGIATILTPLAATGFAIIMIGAAITHARRKETPLIGVNLLFLVLAAVVAWGRFGPYAF